MSVDSIIAGMSVDSIIAGILRRSVDSIVAGICLRAKEGVDSRSILWDAVSQQSSETPLHGTKEQAFGNNEG